MTTLEILACPECRGALALRRAAGGEKSLRCVACQKEYPIRDGIVHFLHSADLTGLNRAFAGLYDWFSWIYRPAVALGFRLLGTSERRVRTEILGRLEPRGGRVLDISTGPGNNLPYLKERADVGEVFALDISLGQLRRCRAFIRGRGWPVELFLANAEALPYRDGTFAAVVHVGGINFFNEPRKAILEMIRVAEPGARIVIADEYEEGARGYEILFPGFSRVFGGKRPPVTVPVDLVPPEMRDVRVSDVCNGKMYLLEFQKPQT